MTRHVKLWNVNGRDGDRLRGRAHLESALSLCPSSSQSHAALQAIIIWPCTLYMYLVLVPRTCIYFL